MKDFSQNGEGKIIADYFGGFVGTLLDCGANDGVTLSNSRGLTEAGWSGVLVEPAAIAYRKLCENSLSGSMRMPAGKTFADVMTLRQESLRADGSQRTIHCINAAITPQDGPVDFYDSGTHLKQGDTSLLSTTRPEELERWKKSGEVFTKTTVRGITFATLVKETGMTHADFISIDAEGADYSILAQIDLRAVGCRMLCVETNGKDNQKFIDYCAQHGMRLFKRVSENLIFCV